MNFLFKTFIKNHEDVSNPEVRDKYGKLAGIVGIISNGILCAMKIIIGSIAGSIAIISDGINNLADASSSVITLVGFKLASLPEDEEHPYGHARIEYLAGMAVSVMILIVGFELLKSSIDKVLHPTPLDFSWILVIVLIIAIGIKIWQAIFNITAGKKINSLSLIATGTDSRNDVISTAVVLLGTLIGHFSGLMIDGYLGILVAAFILWSGVGLVKETVSPLLGEAPDEDLVRDLHDEVLSFEGVLGIHDLIVHNYGPGKTFATVHVEVDSKADIMESHDLMDVIEKTVGFKLGMLLTCHMDPIDIDNPEREPIKNVINSVIKEIDGVINFHDLRFVPGPTHTNVIFDVLLSPECKVSQKDIETKLKKAILDYHENYYSVIDFDISYVKTGHLEKK